jgi:Arc/MetJ-type ribon-helix-helix transcriptional regulator
MANVDRALNCATHVAHSMSTDADESRDGDRMEKIDVRVPAAVLDAIDEEYSRRGYASRSEAIRDALRDWLDPSPELSEGILEELARSREQRERGETRSLDEVADDYDVDLDE